VTSCEFADEPYISKNSEDGIILCSFVLTQYRRVTDRQTDAQTDRNAIANTASRIEKIIKIKMVNADKVFYNVCGTIINDKRMTTLMLIDVFRLFALSASFSIPRSSSNIINDDDDDECFLQRVLHTWQVSCCPSANPAHSIPG